MDLPETPAPGTLPPVQPRDVQPVKISGKPGRPPGSKTGGGKHYTKAEQAARTGSPGQSAPPAPQRRDDPPVEIDADLVADCIVNLYEIGDEFWIRFILKAAQGRIPKERVSRFQAELGMIRFGDKDRNAVKKAVAALVRKYRFLQLWGPEIVLFVHFAQYNYRMYSFARSLAAMPQVTQPNGSDAARDPKQSETPPVRG